MDAGSQEEPDFTKLSIEDRVSHKNWKARLSGYEELARLFSQLEDKEFNKYSPLVKKFVIDSNAAAQEKGLTATLVFVDYCPNAGKYIDSIVSGVATKCLASTRSKSKEIAQDIVLMCVEIEKQDVVIEELVKALEQKTPKNVAATIAMLRKCLNQFGHKVIPIKPIVLVLAKLLEDRDATVREEAKHLAIEIYRWVKDALIPQLNSLKSILFQELQSEFEKHKDQKATPERLLRSQQQRQAEITDGGCVSTETPNENDIIDVPEEVDPFDLIEPVDILTKLPSDFYTLVEAKKWTDRKDGLEKLQQLLESNPKLVTNADYGELVKQLKKIASKDTNIVVATMAIKSLALLANGLRKSFHLYANSCISILLEKFKEKKANVVQATREAIDAVYFSASLEVIQEDLVAFLDNKNPSIRSETALFLARCFAKTNPSLVNKKLLKTLVTSLLKTLNDSDPTVRESSAEALGTLLKAQGDRNMLPLLQGLEALKMTKIQECCAKAEIKKFPATMKEPGNAASSGAGTTKSRAVPRKGTGNLSKFAKPNILHQSNESLKDFGLGSTISAVPKSAPEKKVAGRLGQVKSKLGISSNNEGSTSSLASSKFGTVTNRRATTVTRTGTQLRNNSSAPTTQPTASSANSATSNKQDGPLMPSNLKAKEQRFADERALKILKWNFTTPREEFYILLKEQMQLAEWNDQLVTFCFHADFKFHIKAIEKMRDFFQSKLDDVETVLSNFDLILKWMALRFFDTNPSVITKALEFLLMIFRQCEAAQYSMNDIEANSFLPYLVIKFGDPKDAVRNKVHDILVRVRNIYSPNKIFTHLFTGLQSKNARQRATCLEEITQLIELKGMSLFQAPNSIQLVKDIAKFISERDNSVRNGALACIVQIYFLEGEKVFKLIGNLSDKEMSLVEERIKRAMKNRPSQPIPNEHNNLIALGSGTSLPTLSGTAGLRLQPLSQAMDSNRVSNLKASVSLEIAEQQEPLTAVIGPNKANPLSFGLSKMTFASPLTQQPSYDIGATFSKSRGGTPASSVKQSRLLQLNKIVSTRLSLSGEEQEKGDFYNSQNGEQTRYDENSSPSSRFEIKNGNHDGILDTEFTGDYQDDEMLNQRVQLALSSPPIKLVKRTSRLSNLNENGSANILRKTPLNTINPKLNEKFNDLLRQLSSAELDKAFEALEYLNTALKEQEKFNIYLESRIDQIIILCNKQYRLFLSNHYQVETATTESSANDDQVSQNMNGKQKQQAERLFRAVSSVLNKIFTCPLGKKVSRDTLRELITHLLTYFAEMKSHQLIFNSVNYLMGVVLNGSDSTNLFSALIRMLHDYVNNAVAVPADHTEKFLELTMKFLWRVTKWLDQYLPDLNIDEIILETHLFFKSYPRQWWKVNNQDGLPLRTIKTLVYFIVEKKGDSILDHFTLIQNKNESELSYYIQKALRQCERNTSNSSNEKSTKIIQNNSSSKSNISCSFSQSLQNKDFSDLKENKPNGESCLPYSSNLLNGLPLKTKQMNVENSSESVTIPIIRSEDDLRVYINHSARLLNLDIDYDQIKMTNAHKSNNIKSLEDAQRVVSETRQKLTELITPLPLPSSKDSTTAMYEPVLNENDE